MSKFKVGDKVKVIQLSSNPFCMRGTGNECCEKYIGRQGTIFKITEDGIGVCNFEGTKYYCGSFSQDCLELVGEDRGMEKRKLRERIRDFTGWNKDADDILGVIEMQAGGCYQLLIPFGSYGNIKVEERGREDTCYFYFPFCSQREKLEAFKKACHWVLDFGVKNGKADRCSGQNERNS